ncbi:MAG: hypothetical protein OQL16_08895 [Gammaproteobacteria bacterium]|nr:hypothetical protein [Gammaproteobacteria bacterium]
MTPIFPTSKANWEDICGDLPRYEPYEPDRQALENYPFRAHLLPTYSTRPGNTADQIRVKSPAL